MCAPSSRGPNFFHFHAVFDQKNRLAHLLWELAPRPEENPGSTTAKFMIFIFHSGKYRFQQVYIGVFLNVSIESAEFSDKNICQYSKRARTCKLLCKRQECCHSPSKTHVRDRIFKLSPIHASVIHQIP